MIGPGTLIKSGMLAVVVAAGSGQRATAVAKPIDLSKAVVVVPDGLSGPENKAARLLVEEVRIARSSSGTSRFAGRPEMCR